MELKRGNDFVRYDVLLQNGHVIDPLNEIDAVLDIAIKDGKIAAVAAGLNAAEAETTYDMTGLYITPGLVDTHVHCYYTGGNAKSWAGEWSLQPDYFNFPGGVTTIVDAGSAGSLNFPHFRITVIERAKSRIYAFLNAADCGMASLEGEQFPEKMTWMLGWIAMKRTETSSEVSKLPTTGERTGDR